MPPRKRNTPRSVTILDVAKRAGVSPMTASRVINKHPRVGAELRDRVQAAAKELNYRPNLAGRSLRTSNTARIGVLYSNPSAAYLNQLMIGVLEETSLSGAQVLVEKCSGIRSQRVAMKRLLDAGIDGVILPPPLCDSRQTTQELDEADIPVVAVATGQPAEGVASVRIDDYHGACAMMRHLIKLGHTRIALIKGDPKHTPAALRAQAYFDTMEKAGLEVPENYVAQGLFTYRSGMTAARALLELPTPPTAIFSSNDDMAAAAVSVAHGIGLHVPEDVTVTGFDDTPVATTIWPMLTTVHQPVSAMGRAAVRLMLEEIRRRRAGRSKSGEHQVMKYTLVKRQSSAAPPGR
ncbi:LacI family DNA-binding transcriptional regulator [Oleiagrimonas sp. C23AA]|uniref:LacI family DNA-binding transcriptional regulator n=1 Tax=Oleiagrimonas sp. C23AA TaxID=2719047 RepID=UPI00141F6060|nr:LacI family DNA-binding transcriptional regulator [Oleiagrimonas sp. C23AA]NII09936.1 LacI family transcriptional regulator [Oleiagrimonas sp. C23AA]